MSHRQMVVGRGLKVSLGQLPSDYFGSTPNEVRHCKRGGYVPCELSSQRQPSRALARRSFVRLLLKTGAPVERPVNVGYINTPRMLDRGILKQGSSCL